MELVKDIIVNLARNLESGRDMHEWTYLPIKRYLERDQGARPVCLLATICSIVPRLKYVLHIRRKCSIK